MLTHKITYSDFNEDEVTETLYFNISAPELMKWGAQAEGSISSKIRKITEGKISNEEIVEFFDELITRSYGEKSDDGKHFRKGGTIVPDFMESAAYDFLFTQLTLTGAEFLGPFVEAILPKKLLDEAAKLEAADKAKAVPTATSP